MSVSPTDRSHESVINDVLATLLRERTGLNASSETLHVGFRPDIIVRTPDGPVIVEVEFEPARTLEADGYVTKTREGRRLRYSVDSEMPLRHKMHEDKEVGDLLEILGWEKRRKKVESMAS